MFRLRFTIYINIYNIKSKQSDQSLAQMEAIPIHLSIVLWQHKLNPYIQMDRWTQYWQLLYFRVVPPSSMEKQQHRLALIGNEEFTVCVGGEQVVVTIAMLIIPE